MEGKMWTFVCFFLYKEDGVTVLCCKMRVNLWITICQEFDQWFQVREEGDGLETHSGELENYRVCHGFYYDLTEYIL
jgi:hypothetical protein